LLYNVRLLVGRADSARGESTTPKTQARLAIQRPLVKYPPRTASVPLALRKRDSASSVSARRSPVGWYYPVEKPESPVLDAMNVKYVVAGSKYAERLTAAPRFRMWRICRWLELFENLAVMPRFFLVHDAVPESSLAETRRLIASGVVDLHRTAITTGRFLCRRARRGPVGDRRLPAWMLQIR